MSKLIKILGSTVIILFELGIWLFDENLNKIIDVEWMGFFSGFFFASGVSLSLSLCVKKNKTKTLRLRAIARF